MNFSNTKIQKLISSLLILAMFMPAFFILSTPKQTKALLGVGDYGFVDPGPAWSVILGAHTASLTAIAVSTAATAVSTGISAGVDASTVFPVTWKNVAKEILRQFLMLLARRLLTQLTQSVVNWINSGYWGNPLFVEDPKSFFNDIAKYEIRTFVELTGYDYLRFPFGKDFALELIDSSQRQLDNNLESSLSKVFTDPILMSNFRSNFEVGGWNGFLINTQYPQNNYLGYRMLASEAMLRKLDGTATNKAKKVIDTLDQGLGFLSPQTCADNGGNNEYNKTIINQFKRPGFDIAAYSRAHPFDEERAKIDPVYRQQWDADFTAAKAQWDITNSCRNLVATTPGSVIANQITGSLSSNRVNKELAAAMGNSIAAILDALIGKFMNKGLNALSNAIDPNDQDRGVTQDNFSDPIFGTIGGALDRSGQTPDGGGGNNFPIPTYDQCVASCNAAVESGIDATSCIEISCSSLLPSDTNGGDTGSGENGSGADVVGSGTAPNSLESAIQAERAKYQASFVGLCGSSGLEPTSCPLGAILNTVAWNNRANGWGLSRKTGGHRCPSPVGDIACDILHHQGSNIIVDVFIDGGAATTPTWDVLGPMTDNNRPWVAPAQP